MKKRSSRAIWIHLISWAIIFILPYINYIFEPERFISTNWGFILIPFSLTFFLFVTFYFNLLFLAPKFLSKGRNFLFVVLLFLGLGVFFAYNHLLIYELLLKTIAKIDQAPKRPEPDKNWQFFARFILPSIVYSLSVLVSTILYLLNERRRQSESRQLMELEKVATELSMLKLQISPHFLFNTLNNIRWLVRKKSENAEESILKLSEILRYIIYEVDDTKVALSREVEHLRNYIELQTLRISDGTHIKFEVSDAIGNPLIEPLLFIHFVENAFKYGINGKNMPEIHFEISPIEKGIKFTSKNKILNPKNTLENEGVGLANIKRRLELLYPGRYELEIQSSEDYFEVLLNLHLNEN
jgi:sensor histidine kinase YesM